MQSDRVLTNFWAGNFPLALESRERDSGDNGVSAYFGGGGVASLVPTREIEAAASNDFESTRLVGRVIQFEYVCVAPKIRPCFADDSHRRSRNRSSRPDLHPARQFFFAADPSDSSLYHPSPPLKREGLHGSITMVRRGRRGGRTLGPALNLCKCMPAIF